MRAPDWLRIRRSPVQVNPGTVTLDTSLDLTGWNRAMAELAGSAQKAAGVFGQLQCDLQRVRERQRRLQEVRQAGHWARGYVMGGLDPTLDEAERDRLVKDLASQGRADLAVAVIQGWAENRLREGA